MCSEKNKRRIGLVGDVEPFLSAVSAIAVLADVKAEVEANHDDNRWWPTTVTDWRLRMVFAGWSTRVSYAMIGTFKRVVSAATDLGYESLCDLDDTQLFDLIRPLGMATVRIAYLRSLASFIDTSDPDWLLGGPADDVVSAIAHLVHGASYKVGQCAVLYSRGYHCGVMPVDSGMVDRLAPFLGLRLGKGSLAHEEMRAYLEYAVAEHSSGLRALVAAYGYKVSIPHEARPTWWTHLVLIYFKRLYLNRVSAKTPTVPSLAPQNCERKQAPGVHS